MFGYAPEQQAIEPTATTCRDHNQINIALFRFVADFVDWKIDPDFHGPLYAAQEVKLAERFHVQPRIFEIALRDW